MKTARGLLLCTLLLLVPTQLSIEETDELVFWNVGQGHWASLITPFKCLHFDMGGERAPWPPVLKKCRNKKNLIAFSHWDLDHINFAPLAVSKFKQICVHTPPGGAASDKRRRLLNSLQSCAPSQAGSSELAELRWAGRQAPSRSRNHQSRVFIAAKRAIMPGDSTAREGKFWRFRLAKKLTIRLLSAGHHGSKTSTSNELLASLPHLNQVVVSARKARYGHPHAQVRERLKKRGVALLETEKWGHLHFQLPPPSSSNEPIKP